jgi:hypothetical protein
LTTTRGCGNTPDELSEDEQFVLEQYRAAKVLINCDLTFKVQDGRLVFRSMTDKAILNFK